MKNCLAIECATEVCSVALSSSSDVVELHGDNSVKASAQILELVSSILVEANMTIENLDAVVLSVGPGSFIGVRTAVSVVQGLAMPFELPIYPVSTLQALAQNAYLNFGYEKVNVALDARMNEIYYGCYQVDDNKKMQCAGVDRLIKPQDLIIDDASATAVGNGWVACEDLFDKNIFDDLNVCDEIIWPSAKAILDLVVESKMAPVSVVDLEPLYLRNNIADENARVKK